MDWSSSAGPWQGGRQTLALPPNSDRSPSVPGASQHPHVFFQSQTSFDDNLLSFLSYIKDRQIPIFSVALPDVRSVLGRGASFFVNGAEMPETSVDESTGEEFKKGSIVALKRAVVPDGTKSIDEGLTKRIHLLFNEVLTMRHPPLAAHPNIVQLLGIGFEVEGHESDRNVVPVLVPECAELGNLAEVLETRKRDGRPLAFDQKLAFCIDVAHGLEALHACDIIHGDVKCENVLVFENAGVEGQGEPALTCKLIDFGFSHLDASSGFALGGSPPWQAPELLEENYFKIESAKRTDIYSFGLLVWRLMLDGDPFEPLENFPGEEEKDKRAHRNEHLALLKLEDRLVGHTCDTLDSSGILSKPQLNIVYRVMRRTLAKDPLSRELSLANIIKLLRPDFWYKSRQPVDPERISFPRNIDLLDIERHFHEFRKVDSVVKEKVAQNFLDHAHGSGATRSQIAGAAYQVAVCYALGFGVPSKPEETVKWLEVAAMNGFQRAKLALPQFRKVFDNDLGDYVIPPTESIDNLSLDPSGTQTTKVAADAETSSVESPKIDVQDGKFYVHGQLADGRDLLIQAAESSHYRNIELILANGLPGNTSTGEGVTPFHYLSAWDLEYAKDLGKKLLKSGGDINANAHKGTTLGGTPLMWSAYEDRFEHSMILLDLGSNPTVADDRGLSALTLCARLHLHTLLRILLRYTKPIEAEAWLYRMMIEVASGESRFSRIIRHGKDWPTAPLETLKILQTWHTIFHGLPTFNTMLLSALKESLNSPFGPSNTDIQTQFLDVCQVAPADCITLLGESILTDNKEMFDNLITRKIPVASHAFPNDKTLLHLCAQNPNNTTTIKYFAEQLLKQPSIDVNAYDRHGQTPFMDALLARKWDLAWLLLNVANADPLATNTEGYNVIGLIIRTLNLGAAKWAFKYSGKGDLFRSQGFLVHPGKNISAVQEAALLSLPRAHGMKTEVSGLFLFILSNFMNRERIDYRSDGILPNGSALDIAAVDGNVHAVKALVKKGAHGASGETALKLAREALKDINNVDDDEDAFMKQQNLERCCFIIENWERDPTGTEKEANKWTKLRTIDEDNVRDSWEVVAWEWKVDD